MNHVTAGRDINALSGGDLFKETGLKFEGVEKVELHLHRDGQVTDAPSLPPPPAIYLPSKPTMFVRRDEYFRKLRAALVPQPGMFLLSGDPGSGKSTVAQVFASEVQTEFAAVIYQTCGQRNVEAIVGELADTLKEQLGEEVTRLPAEKKVGSIKSWLQQRRSLFILDDVWLNESAASESTELKLQDLLPNLPASVLFTSRRPSLPWISAENRHRVDAFTQQEVEDAFRFYLGSQMLEHYKEELLEFADRVERLPIAVAVGAQLLQGEFGPLDEAVRQLKLNQLRSEIHDVPSLLQHAIDAQGENERSLLRSASVCAPEDFWLPFAFKVAGLNAQHGASARNRLVNAGLLKLIDQDRQRFHLHSLLREQLHTYPGIEKFRVAHATALAALFKEWQTRWQDCRECLKEIFSAVGFLFSTAPEDASTLSFVGFSCAVRIGELETALQIEQQQEELWFNSSYESKKYFLQGSYGNQALILKTWGRLEEALALLKKQEAICLELGNKDGVQASYGNQALILQAWGRLEEALALLKKQEAICLELGNKDGVQASYGNQALILQVWGRLEEALALLKKVEAISLELDDKDNLQRSYGNQALILKAWGRLEEALALLKKQEAICLELGNKDSLQRSYGNQALILKAWGRLEEALALHKKQEAICLELGNKNSLQRSYGNQGLILKTWGRLEEALALFKKVETISLELGDKDSLHINYGNQALILKTSGRLEEALTLHKKEEAICLELRNRDDLQRSYGNQADIFREMGKLPEALKLLMKKEAICLELGNRSSLAYCCWKWARLAHEMHDDKLATEKLEAALAIFTELKMPREIEGVKADLNPGQASAVRASASDAPTT